MTIENKPGIQEPEVQNMRSAIEHRATWMYLLVDEMRKNHINGDDVAREAIRRCGVFHGNNKFTQTADFKEFAQQFANELYQKIFEMDIKVLNQDQFIVEFHYCPLVSAWQKLGCTDTEIDTLCDIAMEGDRGIADVFSAFQFELGDTIAKGGKCCHITFTRNKV